MRKRGRQTDMIASTDEQITTTNAAVTADSSQLLPRILMIAHTAMIGDLISICKPIDTIIWICVTSLVVRVIRLGIEKSCICARSLSMTCPNSFPRRVKLNPAAMRAER